MVGLAGVRVPASQDRILEPLLKLGRGAEDPLVHKVNEGEVLQQVVLDGRT